MTFYQKLNAAVAKHHTLLCVGLDSDIEKIPRSLRSDKTPQFTFNKTIIDAAHDLVCAYKPNSAFYEARGAQGITELKMTCDYLRKTYPGIVLILDAKRGDIGSTNKGYVAFAFDYLGADAITLHPFLGGEALAPFLARKDKGCIILCRTSNPGAGEFQDGVSEKVATQVAKAWNKNNNCALVVGATYPAQLKRIRARVGDMPILLPGIGAQGGDVEKALKAGLNSKKAGLIVNSSRGILFAANPREEAKNLRELINSFR